MEPVAGKTGHCFVVGERHQLRALHVGLARLCRAGSPKALSDNLDDFFTVVLDLDIFFPGKNPDLGLGAPMPGRVARL